MLKLLVLDMDGTLLNSDKKVSDGNRQALIEAQEKGIIVSLASGRNCASLSPFAQYIELDKYGGFLIGGNGQEIYEFKTKKLIKGNKVPLEVCKEIVEYALENKMEVTAHNDNNKRFYIHPEGSKSRHFDFNERNYNYETQYFCDEVDLDKIGIYISNQDELEVYNHFKSQFQGKAEVFIVNEERIEVSGYGVNKAQGIKVLCKLNNIKDDEVMIFGDGQNDIDMMIAYPYSVAMGNAFDEVKKIAAYITDTNDHDGVAKAIYKYVLMGK